MCVNWSPYVAYVSSWFRRYHHRLCALHCDSCNLGDVTVGCEFVSFVDIEQVQLIISTETKSHTYDIFFFVAKSNPLK